jgi:hypothetical protein
MAFVSIDACKIAENQFEAVVSKNRTCPLELSLRDRRNHDYSCGN